ncbi:hypothetical protein SAHL_15240 [Salinisphaera orenii YIM 95161]|uniref:Uncharacterized protein n=2 Tax=Salinisphaera TaxID=180541 RepID=A0A423PI02_9GAMM|nr:hypothetical protein SAHL_15240 [Salinisphaera halophila YIM 95161]
MPMEEQIPGARERFESGRGAHHGCRREAGEPTAASIVVRPGVLGVPVDRKASARLAARYPDLVARLRPSIAGSRSGSGARVALI